LTDLSVPTDDMAMDFSCANECLFTTMNNYTFGVGCQTEVALPLL
jgi:hypothetical protein